MSQDFYDVLGVSRDADEDEIKQAYREKATEYHPDVSDDPDAEEKFKRAKKAKEVLTDDEKRQAYDRLGHEQFTQAEKRGGFEGGGAGGRGGMGGDPFGGMGGNGAGAGGFEDIFNQFFGGGGGGGGQRRNRPRQGRDLKTRIEVDLEDAYHGIDRKFTYTRPETCPDCEGEGHPPDADVRTCPECDGQGQTVTVQETPFGRVQQTQTCRRCGGDGRVYSETCSTCGGDGIVEQETTVNVDIPAGVRDGAQLKVQGGGAPGENGGPNGDLILEIHVADHPDFERDGDDLRYQHPISFPQAVFGDTVEVPTVDGTAELDVPAGTQSGETFTLRGEGMPRSRSRGRRNGDLHVQVQVVTPSELNEEQREALEAFAEAGGEEIDVNEGFFEKIKNSF